MYIRWSNYAVYADHAVCMSHLEVQMHRCIHGQQTSKYASHPTKDYTFLTTHLKCAVKQCNIQLINSLLNLIHHSLNTCPPDDTQP